MKLTRFQADVFLFFVAAAWGLSFPLMKLIINDIGTFTLLGIRFFTGAVITAAIFRKHLSKIKLHTLLTSFLLATIIFTVNILQAWGLKFTSSTNAAFLSGLSLIMVPFMAFFFFGKKLNFNVWAGVIFSGVGLYFLTAGDGGISALNIGDGANVLSAFIYAFYIVLIEKLVRPDEAIATGILVLLFSSFYYIVFMFISEPVMIVFSPRLVYILAIMSLFCTAFAYSGHIFAQKATTPVHASLILMFEPVFATLFSLIIPDSAGAVETITLFKIFGIVLIFLGMLAVEFKRSS